jgi:hypothetical protein
MWVPADMAEVRRRIKAYHLGRIATAKTDEEHYRRAASFLLAVLGRQPPPAPGDHRPTERRKLADKQIADAERLLKEIK